MEYQVKKESNFNIRVEPLLVVKVAKVARIEKLTTSELVRKAISQYIDGKK
jgi:hypothetical protein